MIDTLNGFLDKYCSKIRMAGEELRGVSMPPLTEELFVLYEETGNRLKYEDVYFFRRKFLAVFGMLSILDKQKEDIYKLEEVLTDICKEECWALPAHVNRKNNKEWRITIDLFAAETAQSLAEITSVLCNELSDQVKELVKQNVLGRVIIPFFESKVPYAGWEVSEYNWSAVCSGSIGSAALYLFGNNHTLDDLLEKDHLIDNKGIPSEQGCSDLESHKLDDYLDRILTSLTYYIKGFPSDGTCMEGISYFTYGMTYYTTFAEQLYRYSKGKIDLLDSNKLKNISEFQQKCYFKGGNTINFSDGSSQDRFKMGLTSYLSLKFPTVFIPNMDRAAEFDTDTCFRWAAIYRDYIWTKNYIEFSKKKVNMENAQIDNVQYKGQINDEHIDNKQKYKGKIDKEQKYKELIDKGHFDNGRIFNGQVTLPDAEWSICHGNNGTGFAIKGGHNAEPHNHNDIGSFLYVNQRDMHLVELGAGEYTKDYFSENRYTILCNNSFGHSVPIINGKGQQAGKEYGCSDFKTDGKGKINLEFSRAYEEGSLDLLERSIYFDLENGYTEVIDRFQGKENLKEIKENLITCYKPVVNKNEISIHGESSSIKIEVKDLEDIVIEVLERIHYDHDGNEVTVYLIQWEAPIQFGNAQSKYVIYTI